MPPPERKVIFSPILPYHDGWAGESEEEKAQVFRGERVLRTHTAGGREGARATTSHPSGRDEERRLMPAAQPPNRPTGEGVGGSNR